MKSILVAILVLVPAIASATEFERNPDRFPSIGISLGLQGESGETKLTFGGASAKQDTTFGASDITLDTVIPISDSVSLFGALSLLGDRTKADETGVLDGATVDMSGLGLRIGARIYFNGH
jgi:hypothetical protein